LRAAEVAIVTVVEEVVVVLAVVLTTVVSLGLLKRLATP
jgi:hypothetical protein